MMAPAVFKPYKFFVRSLEIIIIFADKRKGGVVVVTALKKENGNGQVLHYRVNMTKDT